MGNNETYLSDWLENKITDNQLKKHISNDDFIAFKKLKNSLENFEIQSDNDDLSTNFQSIKDKIKSKENHPTKVVSMWKYISFAASMVILLASYFYFSQVTTIETDFGQKENITLADNSIVKLNSKSKLSFSNFFKFNRKLNLDGEAYFQVQKGSKFTVNTTQGKVEVLGTKFNVLNADDFFEVVCYEGKVRVTLKETKFILTPGESLRFYKGKTENWVDDDFVNPSWINSESSYKNTPVEVVFEKIENQYGMEISYPKSIENTIFTGTITHQNINTALQSVCIPLHLNYKQVKSNKIEISE